MYIYIHGLQALVQCVQEWVAKLYFCSRSDFLQVDTAQPAYNRHSLRFYPHQYSVHRPTKKLTNTSDSINSISINGYSKPTEFCNSRKDGKVEHITVCSYCSYNTNTVKVLLFVGFQCSWFSWLGQTTKYGYKQKGAFHGCVYHKTDNLRIHELVFLP